jgi:hypothetical protein
MFPLSAIQRFPEGKYGEALVDSQTIETYSGSISNRCALASLIEFLVSLYTNRIKVQNCTPFNAATGDKYVGT